MKSGSKAKIGNRKGNPGYRTPSSFRGQINIQNRKFKNLATTK